ncbi:glycosyltransferase family 4 protein [Methyloferula stellata]|uniref:glycosyltransferase family 4 protein n=1 Tax=Methyloferula stellata TaxID=876270 RepID=UPI00037F3583|nr:glycosyltransferase family 1 protein [Methyloferula stellata]
MQRRIFIDLSDLIVYAANFDNISGIQRIEIELIKLILDQYESIGIINAFEPNSARLKAIIEQSLGDERLLLSRLNDAFSYCNAGPKHQGRKSPRMFFKMLARDISRLFGSRLPNLESGDIVLVPGGFSFDRFLVGFYERLAAKGVRLVFFVQDVLPITRAEFLSGKGDVFALNFPIPAKIITTTHYTVEDFGRAYQIVMKAPCRAALEVIGLVHQFPGVPRNAKPDEPSQRLTDMLQGRPFVLCVGTVEIRKNHLRLLEAWRALKSEFGAALPVLVVAGRRGWKAEAALAFLDHAAENNDPVCLVEKPSDDELKWLYASCTFSVLPSLFEGWGLPVGESLWFGKVCAASRATSVPEVGRDLCVYFDPDSVEEMKAAIRQLLDSAVRKTYEDKIRAATLRTWADVASDLIAVLLKMAETPV